jgi:hypothetical protein
MVNEIKKLRIWHIPQVPAEVNDAFYVEVKDIEEAKKILSVLWKYDQYQFSHHIKPDYCDASGLEELNNYSGKYEWLEWESDEGQDIITYMKEEGLA